MSGDILEPEKIGSYSPDDIVFLLHDIGDTVEEYSAKDRETLIQSGVHYSELLPIEYSPGKKYMQLFYQSLAEHKTRLARYVGITAERILKAYGKDVALVSLVRGGSPAGILIKRYLERFYTISVPHYSISIIRGKGFDNTALHYIRQKHSDHQILFVDGWTGKGAISMELIESCKVYNKRYEAKLRPELAVIADPGHCAAIFGTRKDFLIPSACLNSTVSGLVSRTFHRADIISEGCFHGARFYSHLANKDVSNYYIDTVCDCFENEEAAVKASAKTDTSPIDNNLSWSGLKTVKRLSREFDIVNLNHIKPGVGETTRVLLRRVPWKILIRPDRKHELSHILLLAKERGVPVETYADMAYSCCGLIKTVTEQ